MDVLLSLQITFICLIYPLLILCYAGQAAYISKQMNVGDFNHLSESVPGKFLSLVAIHPGRCRISQTI